MKKFTLLILSLINMAISVIYISLVPADIVPTHYNINGTADVYSSKWSILIMPIVLVAICVIYIIYNTIEVKNNKAKSNKKYADKIIIAIFIFMFVILWGFTIISLNGIDNIGNYISSFICCILGIIMIYISNMFTKLKQNGYLGIKIPATLKSETVWKKTHRLGAYLGVIGGFIVIIAGVIGIFINEYAILLMFAGIFIFLILGVLIPSIYAHILYKKEKHS